METFRTTFPTPPVPFGIAHTDQVLMVGSCFTENIGARLVGHKFPALVNPFGIVYNPVSIARCLERLLAGDRPFAAGELVFQAGLWHSWECHGRLSGPERDEVLARLNAVYRTASDFLKKTNRLLLTLGTAEVFALRSTGEVVANCHKAPASLFAERRLDVAETVAALETVLKTLKTRLPDLQVVLTVSPVRHRRNGPVANQRSKAVLVLACAELCARLPDVFYFPAYELLLDDLRDYRFYGPDLTHPNDMAADYIWRAFGETFFHGETKILLEKIQKIAAAAAHRPVNPESAEHQTFAAQQLRAIAELQKAVPALDFSAEAAFFRQSGAAA